MKEDMYTQCVMHLPLEGGGRKIHVAFIPVEFAKKGRILKIKWEDGEWINGFKVVEVGATKPRSQIYDRDHLTQHLASDI